MGTLLSMEFINNHNVTGECSIRVFLKLSLQLIYIASKCISSPQSQHKLFITCTPILAIVMLCEMCVLVAKTKNHNCL